jgi:zinc/manganese transport system permease protein
MGDLFTYMAAPFAVCLVLTGIHTYLGTHVLARGVIFVDLALAQIAALGTTMAFLMGYGVESTESYWLSLLFTFVGAAVFSLSRLDEDRVPQEAIIGITYVVASAIAILAVDRAPHGAEHIKYLLVGSVLWVTWPEVLKTLVIYALVGVFHWVYRDRFVLISNEPDLARQQGVNIRLWDFLFYASFGFVITSSVRIAGVLLVFSFLIVPSVISALFTRSLGKRLVIGWSIGFLVSAVGGVLSFSLDLPTGATIVVTFGAALLITRLLYPFWRAREVDEARPIEV